MLEKIIPEELESSLTKGECSSQREALNVKDTFSTGGSNKIPEGKQEEAVEIESTVLKSGLKVHLPTFKHNDSQKQTLKKDDDKRNGNAESASSFTGEETGNEKQKIKEKILPDIAECGLNVHLPTVPQGENDDQKENFENDAGYGDKKYDICVPKFAEMKNVVSENSSNRAKRKLFSDDQEKLVVISDMVIRADNRDVYTKNRTLNGLCYSCVFNINSSRIGVRCQFCLRSYHLACILKTEKPVADADFVCNNCKAKKKFL